MLVLSIPGLGIGLSLASYFENGDPFLIFAQASGSLVISVFFGVIGSIIYLSHLRVVEMRAELAVAAAKEAEQAQQATETQLRVLQAQIEPHFLVNTLSNIHSLIERSPVDAQATLENLSILLRRSLKSTREQSITLGEEVEILRAYLDIQSIRMKDRLDYEISVPPALKLCLLPPLLLQPLVENAILHGLDTPHGGWVKIKVVSGDGLLKVKVVDNGVGINVNSRRAAKGHGTGLKNVRSRLSKLYAKQGVLTIADRSVENNSQTGVVVTISLPLTFD